ncbi:MAG: dual specificity protein phosphatase [Cyanobacteria bacterium J06638_7]
MHCSWVLRNELAVGSAPAAQADLERLAGEGVGGLLCLCPPAEARLVAGARQRFRCRRLALPDSASGRPPLPRQLEQAVALLGELRRQGPVYLHCRAGVERSPLVAMGWLMHSRGLPLQAAFEYLREVHPGSAPVPEQLQALGRCRWRASAAPVSSCA